MSTALHTPADLAEKFGKPERWVMESRVRYSWPCVKVGRLIRFTDEQVEQILSRHTVTAPRIEVPALDGQTQRSARRSA